MFYRQRNNRKAQNKIIKNYLFIIFISLFVVNVSADQGDKKVLATFPEGSFLENLEIQPDGRVLITNPFSKTIAVLHPDGETDTFSELDAYPVSIISTNDGYLVAAHGKSFFEDPTFTDSMQFITLDHEGRQTDLFYAPEAKALNGMIQLHNGQFLTADSLAGTIWAVDIKAKTVMPWLEHELLTPLPDQEMFIPGVNGLKLHSDGIAISNTSRGLIAHIKVGNNGEPLSDPKTIAEVGLIDDFWVNEDNSIIFTTHGNELKKLTNQGQIETVMSEGCDGCTAIAPYPINQSETFIVINDGNLYFGTPKPSEVFSITVSKGQEKKEGTLKHNYEEIPSTTKYTHNYIDVLGSKMAYIDVGKGEPILFLHGQPTSSYLWRNIMPHLESQGRLIAPDNIGFGKSDQPELDYTFEDHYRYFDAFMKKLDLNNITLVVHDWGSGLGLHYARLNESRIKAIVTMEALMAPLLPAKSYDTYPKKKAEFSKMIRDPVQGRKLVIEDNFFLEKAFPAAIIRPLDKETHDEYKKPFPTKKSRIQVFQWPLELPIGGVPAVTTKVISAYNLWLEETDIPWLYLYATPGSQNPPEAADYWEKRAKNIQITYIGAGIHYVQEDQPYAIGRAIYDWYRRINKQ